MDIREGQWVYYQINPSLPAWVFDILDVTVQELGYEPKHKKDSERLKIMDGRPEMKKGYD
jgi:ArsR family transcriptional regulator